MKTNITRQNIKWKISEENKAKTSIREYEFLQNQSEKLLKETSDVSEILTNRSTILITINVGLFSALVTGILADLVKFPMLGNIAIACLCGCVYVFIWLVFLFLNVKGKSYEVPGMPPSVLWNNIFFEKCKDEDERIKGMMKNCLEEYEVRINKNNIANNARWTSFHKALLGTILTPLFLLLLYCLIAILR